MKLIRLITIFLIIPMILCSCNSSQKPDEVFAAQFDKDFSVEKIKKALKEADESTKFTVHYKREKEVEAKTPVMTKKEDNRYYIKWYGFYRHSSTTIENGSKISASKEFHYTFHQYVELYKENNHCYYKSYTEYEDFYEDDGTLREPSFGVSEMSEEQYTMNTQSFDRLVLVGIAASILRAIENGEYELYDDYISLNGTLSLSIGFKKKKIYISTHDSDAGQYDCFYDNLNKTKIVFPASAK